MKAPDRPAAATATATRLGDPIFSPLGAPASNLNGPNFTPPFPSYPSGHAGFGGALFQTLRNFYGTDDIPFTFVSDELNGVTRDNHGNVRPLIPRSFAVALAGGGRERPEPHLSRHPLVVRQGRPASSKAGGWRTTSFATPFSRATRDAAEGAWRGGAAASPADGLTVLAVIRSGAIDAVDRQIFARARRRTIGSGKRGSRVKRMP